MPDTIQSDELFGKVADMIREEKGLEKAHSASQGI